MTNVGTQLTLPGFEDTMEGREGRGPAAEAGLANAAGLNPRSATNLTSCSACATLYYEWIKSVNIMRMRKLKALRRGEHICDYTTHAGSDAS